MKCITIKIFGFFLTFAHLFGKEKATEISLITFWWLFPISVIYMDPYWGAP